MIVSAWEGHWNRDRFHWKLMAEVSSKKWKFWKPQKRMNQTFPLRGIICTASQPFNFFLNKTQQTPKYPDPSNGLASFLRTLPHPYPCVIQVQTHPKPLQGPSRSHALASLASPPIRTTRVRTNMGRGSKATGYFLHFIGCWLGILISWFITT